MAVRAGGLLGQADLDFLVGDATPYTPSWASTGTDPTPGNAVRQGAYVVVGPLVWFQFKITFGSTSVAGTGNYAFGLPVTPLAVNLEPFPGFAMDGTLRYPAMGWVNNVSGLGNVTLIRDGASPVAVGATSPFAPNTGDSYWCSGWYQRAI